VDVVQEKSAAIVGAGLIGRAWAMVFARAGWNVRVTDSAPSQLAAARELIALSLEQQQRAGLADDAKAALARVQTSASLADAVSGVAWVQENLPEEVEIKRTVFAELDRLTPAGAILASSTSAIVASHFTAELAGRARCLVAHPVNPPHLVPVVELCGAPWTSEATLARATGVMASVRQVPVRIRREIDGFVLNRLQGALLSEAMRLVADGVISPDDLDKTVRDGLGLRWSFMGPFATIELNASGGVADYCARYSGFYRRLAADPPAPSVWEGESAERVVAALGQPVPPAERERLMQWRDRRLLALRKHKMDRDSIDSDKTENH
jgi:3-hydroxyacyl-CoA dehydrogenase